MTYFVNKRGEELICKGGKDMFKAEILSLLSISQQFCLPHYITGKQEEDKVLLENTSVEVEEFILFFLISCHNEPVISC